MPAVAGPIHVPNKLWSADATIEALARRDVGQLFRFVQRATGATQTRLGVAVGLSQAQVSEIIGGSRRVSSVDVLSRVVVGLGIPEPARSVLFLGEAGAAHTRLIPVQTSADDSRGSADLVAVYAMRGLIPRTKWNDTIRGAAEHLWLYGMAELGYALDDEVPAIVADAAGRDCDIRVLLLDPTYAGTSDIDADEGSPPGTLAARIRSALAHYGHMATDAPNMQIRVYHAAPTVSIVRRDDRMLVTPYLRLFVGSNSPSLELRRASGKMFDRYVKHFQGMWQQAKGWTG